jgi:hypothetical protein
MSMAHNHRVLSQPHMTSTQTAVQATRRPNPPTYCSTVGAHETVQLPEPLPALWSAWNVASDAPESREGRIDAARRALQSGTLCLNPHVLAERLLHHTTPVPSRTVSVRTWPRTRV